MKYPQLALGAIPIENSLNSPSMKRSLSISPGPDVETFIQLKKIMKTIHLEDIYEIIQDSLPPKWSVIFPSNVMESLALCTFSAKVNITGQHSVIPSKEIFVSSDGTIKYNCWGITVIVY